MEAAGIEPAARRKQNPKQVALLPANALISRRIVLPPHPVSFRSNPRWRGTLRAHTAQRGMAAYGRARLELPDLRGSRGIRGSLAGASSLVRWTREEQAGVPAEFWRRRPEGSVLYQAVRDHLATLLAEASEVGRRPRDVERNFSKYLGCKDELLVAFISMLFVFYIHAGRNAPEASSAAESFALPARCRN